MKDEQSHEDFLALFPEDKRSAALERAHDIRKFEIDLYWKRGAYFWTFIAAAFAGYFIAKGQKEPFVDSFLVANLGFAFSVCWYFVNRGSAAWQRNWEAQVDLLEDGVTGPLHKTVINRRTYALWDISNAYAFSPSRISNLLAFLVSLAWLFLVEWTLYSRWLTTTIEPAIVAGLAALPFAIAGVIFLFGRTSAGVEERSLRFRTRRYR